MWRHPLWREFAHDDIDEYCAFVREQTDLRLGIEADFIPGGEDRMANLLEARDFDYVVGSVHFLGDHALDMDDYGVWTAVARAEEIWRSYFQALGEAARSGLFDILAHPDLVKVWGQRAPAAGRGSAPLLRACDGRDRRVGHRDRGFHGRSAQARPGDLPGAGVPGDVPGSGRSGRALERRAPPEDVGADYEQALELLERLGVGELCVFERRRRRCEPIALRVRAERPSREQLSAASAMTRIGWRRAAR